MHPDYFSILQRGVSGELDAITLPEMLAHLRNHIGNFLLDHPTINAYVLRLLAVHGEGGMTNEGLEALVYLLRKNEQIDPFEPQMLRLLHQLVPSPELEKRIRVVEGVQSAADQLPGLNETVQRFGFNQAVPRLEALLKANPHDVGVADTLLLSDFLQGQAPGPWLDTFQPVKPLQAHWDRRLFLHYAGINDVQNGLELFHQLPDTERGEFVLNGAAELLVKAGDRDQAVALYARSLELDPDQTPVRCRREELLSPLQPRPDLIAERPTAIYLYTYNKADQFRQTLESLSRTDIGQSPISILVNGCSDHSLEVARSAEALFPDNAVDIIDLPVNVGAPAARNWLINREHTWRHEYAVFLDDDVFLQRDWLAWFLAAMESRPKAAVVGCKVLDPGEPARYQYLYRSLAIVRNDLIKLSLARPSRQFDTGLYNFLRPTRNVMGCQHMFRTSALRQESAFDIHFSPSQVDDIDHDLLLCLKGYEVLYCGQVACVHAQSSGLTATTGRTSMAFGNAAGNDLKFFYKHRDHLDALRGLDSSL